MTILIFDGIDKVGKDSLVRKFHSISNYKYSVISRFSGTSICYGKYYNRKLDYKSYFFQDLFLMNKAILFYLYCDKEILKKRFIEHNEKDIDLNQSDSLLDYYDDYLEKTPLKVIRIDTSMSIEECAIKILREVIEFEKESPDIKVQRLEKAIFSFGDRVNNETLELRDIVLDFKNINLVQLFLELKKMNSLFSEEFYEYNQIYHSLINIIRLKLNYFKNQSKESRQFIYHSESCVSLFQILYRKDILNHEFLEGIVTIRSSNVKKMLLFDIYNLYNILARIDKKFFNTKNIALKIHINSAHIFLRDYSIKNKKEVVNGNNKKNKSLQEL